MNDALETFYPKSQNEWRNWLEKNHDSKKKIWVIMFKKNTKAPTISWSEAVDEALCFGWIDSTRKTHDKESFIQYFCPRKPSSTWSKVNKEKVAFLIENGQMQDAGMHCIEIAKKNGSWTILDTVDKLLIPDDLEVEFNKHPNSKDYFLSLSNSVKKRILYWVISAKRTETRERRIKEIAELAGESLKPKQFR